MVKKEFQILQLEIEINGDVIETVSLSPNATRIRFNEYLSKVKSELLNKHHSLVSTAKTPVQFFLTGVTSKVNFI